MERTGRPPDPHIGDALLDATITVLSEVGYARLTLEAVARRAGTTKPAIYRRWPSRQRLVLAALAGRLGTSRVPDSGCVVCDLVTTTAMFLTACERVPPGALGSLLADCAGEPDLRAECVATLFEPPRLAAEEAIDRAQTRGDLRADLDRELVVDLLAAFVHYRALFGHAPTDPETVEVTVATLLRGMAADYPHLAARRLDHRHPSLV